MPVAKHRRVEDLPPPRRAPGALEGLRSACDLSALCAALGPSRRAPRGVRRFRSVAEADGHRRWWEHGAAPGTGPEPGHEPRDLSTGA